METLQRQKQHLQCQLEVLQEDDGQRTRMNNLRSTMGSTMGSSLGSEHSDSDQGE